MTKITKTPIFVIILLCASIPMMFLNTEAHIVTADIDPLTSGPYLDKVIFEVISQDDQQVLALMDDEIDLIGDMVDPAFYDQLEAAPNIETAEVLRNGYGYMVINCQKYPYNITAFRRALTFAIDKAGISETVWDGRSQPQDSPVPSVNPWSIEGQLPYSYYQANVAQGNALLDAAGFVIDGVTGFREAPNGEPFSVTVECAQSSGIAIEVGQYVADALVALGVNATSVPTDFYDYMNRLYVHGDYDIVFLGSTFTSFDVDWLAYEFWSDYADEPYQNYAGFANATYDSWRDQLLYSTDYDEVYEAAIEMQKILVYESPYIICYANTLLTAYRTDKFEDFVNDVSDGVPSWWTNYKAHLQVSQGGPFGGTLRISTPLDIDTFNFMTSSSAYASQINDLLWDSLMRQGPDGTDVFWLAEDYIVETHDDNAVVPSGYTQFTFDIIQNATWTDGSALTAEDIAFTLNYYKDGSGNPYGPDLALMAAAYAPTTYQLVVQFTTESYWHLSSIAYKPVLPEHVFSVLGVSGWNTWSPNPYTMVTSGPFTVTSRSSGEYTELTRRADYFYARQNPLIVSDSDAPIIDHPDDVSYAVGTTGNTIKWTPSDANPSVYSVMKDLTMYDFGLWDGSPITVNIDGLALGTYNFTIAIFDAAANFVFDTVIVYVLTDVPPEISSPSDISYAYGSSGNEISWIASDNNPDTYDLYRDGVKYETSNWDGGNITIPVDGLDIGIYNITIVLIDEGGNSVSDTVMVEVESSGFLLDNLGTMSLLLTIGGVAVIVILGGLMLKNRG